MAESEDQQNELPEGELEERVLYSLLAPAVRLAFSSRIPLKAVTRAVELAYFHQMRASGLKMREISPRLDIGMRKAAQLSKRLKSLFFTPERAAGLPRRIEHMLWAGPLSEARIRQALDVSVDEVSEALSLLLDEDRIRAEEIVRKNGTRSTHYRISRSASRLVRDSWIARIDGLNWLLRAVGDNVQQRFFAGDESAFARVVTFHIRPEQYGRLERLYQDVVWPLLAELDRDAEGAEDAIAVDLVFTFGKQPPPPVPNAEEGNGVDK